MENLVSQTILNRYRVTDTEDLKEFADKGYQYKQELSGDSTWVYVRD